MVTLSLEGFVLVLSVLDSFFLLARLGTDDGRLAQNFGRY
jgi:hypothetical protein